MWDIVEGIHKALKFESTLVFVLVIAVGAALVAGFFAWIVDTGYKNSSEYKAEHAKIEAVAEPQKKPVADLLPTVTPASLAPHAENIKPTVHSKHRKTTGISILAGEGNVFQDVHIHGVDNAIALGDKARGNKFSNVHVNGTDNPRVAPATWSTEQIPSTHADSPFALRIILAATVPIQPTGVIIHCSEEIDDGVFNLLGPGGGSTWGNETGKPDSHSFYLHFDRPQFNPANPIQVTLWSKKQFTITQIGLVEY